MQSLLSFLSLSLLSLTVSAEAPASGFCKAIPGTLEWPSSADWAQLNSTLRGTLLAPAPPGSICHQGWPAYDPARCSTLKVAWMDSNVHTNDPVSGMWQNYNNYSCTPDANSSCSGAGYPVYVAEVNTAEDVKSAVDFAREKKIRLNIKSTGHDFLGRSTQPNSLSIWTHKMTTQNYVQSFVPEGCKAPIPGLTALIGAGTRIGNLTLPTAMRNVMMVVGSSNTVSVGGYIANGGHGPLSAKYGLAADMVAEIELVTADGRIIKANECQNQDYFWAMRGGGGSTFGVATRFAIQTIPTVPTCHWTDVLRNWNEMVYMHQQWPKVAAAGGAGYIGGIPGAVGLTVVEIYMPNCTAHSDLIDFMDPIVEGMRGRHIVDGNDKAHQAKSDVSTPSHVRRSIQNKGTYSWHSTWAEAQEAHSPSIAAQNENARSSSTSAQAGMPFPGTGNNKIIASWLWSSADCAGPHVDHALRGAFWNDSTVYLLNDMTMGVGTWNPPYLRGGSNAVNPAFRTAVMRLAAEFSWFGTDGATLAKKKQDALKAGIALKMVNPDGGTYANEADPSDPDWKKNFWGSNYERLAAFKAQVDPEGLFYCRACVGSDLWEDNAGVLCKK